MATSTTPLLSSPLPDSAKPLSAQEPTVLFAMCLWGEARNQSSAARLGVACVVRNRVLTRVGFGRNWSEVIGQHGAFSCLAPQDVNYQKLFHPDTAEGSAGLVAWRDCFHLASAIMTGEFEDPTGNAVFYIDRSLPEPPHAVCLDPAQSLWDSKAWGKVQRTVRIDALTFYRAVMSAGNETKGSSV